MSKIFFDENAEKQLLACMIMDNKVICDVIAKTQASMFHEAKHSVIYENIIKLYKSGINVDLCTLTTELMNNGLLPAAGNAGYVASLTDEVPTASNFNFYQDKIIKYAQCRALYLVLKDNLEKLGQADNSTIFKNLEDNVFKISSK